MYEFEKSASKLEDGKPVKGRQGRLTKTASENLKKYFGNAIRNNVTRDVSSAEERGIGIKKICKMRLKLDFNTAQKRPD